MQEGFFVMVELLKIGKDKSVGRREEFLYDLTGAQRPQGILLQTCNRVELYHGQGDIPEDITEHLFRVVSGLDSTIIGETAIVYQVKQAYSDAVRSASLDKSLHKLFQTALFVGKKVRRETGISIGAMSHGQAAVNLLLQRIGSIKNINITVIGVNHLNEKIIRFLVGKGASTIFIGNRTYNRAKELAEKYSVKALRFDAFPEILENTDVLISATSAPHPILRKERFNSSKEIVILDLAVPRDIDPAIKDFPNVTLYDIESIETHLKKNMKMRAEKIGHAEEIIKREVQLFSKNRAYA